MFGGKARQYPHLVGYLHHLSRRPTPAPGGLPLRAALGLGGIWSFVTVIAATQHQAELSIPAALVCLGLGALYARGNRSAPSPRAQRQQEAREVADVMRRCLDLRRLHRDLDEGSLILIEECARHWSRVHGVFSAGFWSDPNLSPTYAAAREQALAAADEGMEDVLILYRPCLPVEVKGRQTLDYVEEALEQYVFKGQVAPVHPPAAFGPARQVADRLRDLATEAERIAGDLSRERANAPAAPTGSLDASLGELRAIRQAEDELRQNLRG
jgi:hypothetical protein